MKFLVQLFFNLGLGVDQLANVLLLGDPDESLSGRLGRAELSGKPKWWVRPLARANDWLWYTLRGEENHCANAVEHEECPGDKELWCWFHK